MKRTNEDIAAAVGKTTADKAKQKQYRPSQDWVYNKWRKIYEEGTKQVPIITPKGDIIGDKCADLTNAARAVENIGKLLGMYVDRSQVELSSDVKQTLDRLIKAVADEVEDPEIMGRIVSRLTGQDGGPDTR
jgi:hypothetical protein